MEEHLREVCRRLLEHDPDIVEIAQFGSSVYAPELARDVDLIVVTRQVKGYEGYLDAANPEGAPFSADVVVLGVGDRLREELPGGFWAPSRCFTAAASTCSGALKSWATRRSRRPGPR
jgi:hypothetical protein